MLARLHSPHLHSTRRVSFSCCPLLPPTMKFSQPSTFPLTPPFTPSSSSWSDEIHYDHHPQHSAPLERVDSFDLDGSVARSYDWEESDGSGSESGGEEHVDEPMDEPLGGGGKASLSPMDGGRLGTLDEEDNEGDADALQEREKGAGGSAKLRVVIVTGQSVFLSSSLLRDVGRREGRHLARRQGVSRV